MARDIRALRDNPPSDDMQAEPVLYDDGNLRIMTVDRAIAYGNAIINGEYERPTCADCRSWWHDGRHHP